MSYASLVGLPDAGDSPQWWFVSAEHDAYDDPEGSLPPELQALGDRPTFDDIIDRGAGDEYLVAYHGGLWQSSESATPYPFCCEPGSCAYCDAGRAASPTWGAGAAIDHIF